MNGPLVLDTADTALVTALAKLVDSAENAGLRLRLLGGLAVRFLCPSAQAAPFRREYSDADCATLDPAHEVESFFSGEGWAPFKEFNSLNGDERLIFVSPAGLKIDIFLKRFTMCHEFSFKDRIPPGGYTLYPADILLTKLQIHEINEKDLMDAACLVHDIAPGTTDQALCVQRLARICASDWGVYRSITGNLNKVAAWAKKHCSQTSYGSIQARIHEITREIDTAPKGMGWKTRALVGDRVRWYQDVEEVDR